MKILGTWGWKKTKKGFLKKTSQKCEEEFIILF